MAQVRILLPRYWRSKIVLDLLDGETYSWEWTGSEWRYWVHFDAFVNQANR